MRLFAKRYLLLTALIAAAVFISNVNAKTRVRHSHGINKNSVHENHLEHTHHKRSSSYPRSSGLSGSGKRDKNYHSSSSSKLPSSKKPAYPPSGGLSGSRHGNSGLSPPVVHKPVSKPISSYNKTHGSGSGTRHPGSYPPTNSGNGISGNGRKNLTAPHSAKLTAYPPSNGMSGGNRNNTGRGKNNTANWPNQKPGTSYPPSHGGLSGGGSYPSGSYKTTPKPLLYPPSKRPPTSSYYGNQTNQNAKNDTGSYQKPGVSYPPSHGHSGGISGSYQTTSKPASYPSSKRPPTSLFGNRTNQAIITPKNVSGSYQKPGTSYPPSHGLSGGGSGSYQTTQQPPLYPSSKRPPTSLFGNRTNQAIITPKNVSGSYQKPGTSYPPSHGLSGGRSGSYQTTQQPPLYPSSKRPPTSSFGNRTNQAIITPKNVSGSYQKPGTSYPPSHGLSGGGSGSYQTTHKPPLYPPSMRPPGNNPNGIYQPVVVHHIHSYESHSSYLPHQKIHTYKPAFVYDPPKKVYFKNSHGNIEKYPVYNNHNVPPYVNDYRNSDNKYGSLLSGLALYNLGMLSGSHSKNEFHKQYVQKPDEICIFEAKYKKGNTDEMAIDCILMTYFIFMDEYKNPIPGGSSGINNDTQVMLPNGILVSDKVAYQLTNADSTLPPRQIMRPAGTIVYRASEPIFYGKPVDYKLLKECNIGRSKLFSDFKKEISCGLLQTYAEKSWRANYGSVLKSSISVILIAVCVLIM